MTDAEIIEQFAELLDETENPISDTLAVQLANNAKNKLETELKLAICEKLDTSLSSTVGGTYLTAYDLEDDFLMLSKDILYVGTTQRTAVQFGHREMYKNDSSKFYIDYRQNKLYLCGTVQSSETITVPYIYETADIDGGSNTNVTWPTRFHSLIPYEMAKLFFAIDQGERSHDWSPEWSVAYNQLKSSLIDWDASIKLSAIGGVTPYGPDSSESGQYQINLS
jgi:hypothetical protein